jgi:hypothetical protein
MDPQLVVDIRTNRHFRHIYHQKGEVGLLEEEIQRG